MIEITWTKYSQSVYVIMYCVISIIKGSLQMEPLKPAINLSRQYDVDGAFEDTN